MKYQIRNSFLTRRHALAASVAVVLTGTIPAFGQAGGAGSSNYGTNPSAPSGSSSTTGTNANEAARSGTISPSTPGTPYQTRAGGDVDSTNEINTRNAANMPGKDKLSWGDRRFVTKAADNGQSELQLAQLAAQRATNPEVKNFAQKLVTAHTKANTELKSLASQKNVTLDTDNDQDRVYKRLSKKSGAEFDQEFVEHMVDEHEKDVKMFEKASNDARDTEVRAFASKHVGHLRDHLQQAQSLRQAVMPTGRMDDSSGRSTSGGSLGAPSSSTTSGSTRSDSNYGTSGTGGATGTGATGTSSSGSTSGSPATGSGSSGTSTTPRR